MTHNIYPSDKFSRRSGIVGGRLHLAAVGPAVGATGEVESWYVIRSNFLGPRQKHEELDHFSDRQMATEEQAQEAVLLWVTKGIFPEGEIED